MTEYGYAISKYKGTYQLAEDGSVSLRLDGFAEGWPEMVLEKDAQSLLLRAKDSKQGFVMGSRGGATIGGGGSYWPFRPVKRE